MTADAFNVAGTGKGASEDPLFAYLLRLGDDRLVLGHRLSEWCGHGPILEEDIAIANMALDLIGHATSFLKLAGEVERKGRDEDALAYFRDETAFRNLLIVELPRGDFGFTIARQFLFDAYSVHLLDQLSRATYEPLAAIAAKCLKETRYHLRHTSEWVLRLGDGTDESHARIQKSFDELWRFTGEFFVSDNVDAAVASLGIAVDYTDLERRWREVVTDVLKRATLVVPPDGPWRTGGRTGRHTESLGHMLSVMQSVARAHPGATW